MTIGQWIRAGLEDVPKKNTIPVLDGVRAFACLIVIWFHIYRIPRDLQIWPTQPAVHKVLNSFLFFGRYGVTLFFVLSGFLLFLPFVKALLFEQSWPSIRQFYLKRVFRIMPAYYLSLILIVLIFQRQYLQPEHWKELGLFFIFFMDSTQATFKQLNAPYWTLAIEWQYYMLLPLLVLGMRLVVWRARQNYRLFVTIACVLAIIGWGIFTRYYGAYFLERHPTESLLVPRPVLDVILFFTYGISGKYLEDFGVGMLLALCFVYARHPSISPRIRQVLQKLSPWLWGVGLFCLLIMVLWSYNQSYPNTWPLFSQPWLFQYSYLISELCISFSFGLCVLALLFGPMQLKRPFEWFPLRGLGLISYSLYMWHLPLLLICMQRGQSWMEGWSPEQAYGVYWLWVLVVVIPFCFLFYRWVEKPGMKLGERFKRPRSEAALVASDNKASLVEQGRRREFPELERSTRSWAD
ncbi:acyltransferase family protein [Ktedonosporobacter rubrisoli]|nr:acyltransferase [Ktedonosporobacter rubrisoli]